MRGKLPATARTLRAMSPRIVFGGTALVCAGGVWWFSSSGVETVRISDADKARSVADGSGARRIRLEGTQTDGVPPSLEELAAIGDQESLRAARERLHAALESAGAEAGRLCVLMSDISR